MCQDYCLGMDLVVGQRLKKLPGPVLVTGHTGFKGTWLTLLLQHFNIPVIGLSLDPEKDSLYDRASRVGSIPEEFLDIRNTKSLTDFITMHEPSAIIHMAAQPLVLESYRTPRETFETNVMGTVNILEAAFKTASVEAVVVVTSDKVYRNDNSGRSFNEQDPLEGKDPYSASKVATEAAVASWQQIAKITGGPRVISVRAGNVIGGGDWSKNRLVPDLIRGLISGETVQIRNPESTRPWQHVLDPLHGYLLALEAILNGEDFLSLNFGPLDKSMSVREICQEMKFERRFRNKLSLEFQNLPDDKESIVLGLDTTKACKLLNWQQHWSQKQSIARTLDWWADLIVEGKSPSAICKSQIERYLESSK